MEEYWKDIPGYEGLYQVSNYCRVKNIKRKRILKACPFAHDYLGVGLHKNGEVHNHLIHRLGMFAFVPNPDNLPQVNHKDEDRTNNFIWVNPDGSVDLEKSNLEWCDAKYNINYGTGIYRRSKQRVNAPDRSKSVLQYSLKGQLLKEYPSIREAQRQTGVHNSHIIKCCKEEYQQAGGFIWRYK